MCSSLDGLVKNLGENDFKHLSQEFDSEVLNLVKHNGCHFMYICKIFETLPSKNKLYSSVSGKGISETEYKHVLKVWNKFEMNKMRDYHDFYLNVMFYC